MTDLLTGLIRINLVIVAAVLVVLALRLPARRFFGSPVAYGLWLAVPLSVAAALLPARLARAPKAATAGYALFDVPPAVSPAQGLAGAPLSVVEASAPLDLAPHFLAAWLAGVLIAGGMAYWAQRRFLALADQSLAGPAVVGFIRPRLILPADFEQRFTAAEREVILAHEHVHLARGDSRINTLVVAVQCLGWFNPFVHLAAHFVRVDQELACDAAVVDARPDRRRIYAEALLKTQLAATPLLAGCYWPPRAAHPLNRRIAMLKFANPSALRRGAGVALIAAASLAGGYAAWAAQPPRVSEPAAVKVARAAAPPPPVRQLFETQAEFAQRQVAEARAVDPNSYDIFPESRPPVVDDARAARIFAGMDKTIERELASRTPTAATPTADPAPAPAPTPTVQQLLREAVAQQRRIYELAINVSRADLAQSRNQYEVGIRTRTDVARADARVAQAEFALKMLELTNLYYEGVRDEHQVGLRTREELQAAERDLMRYLTPSAPAPTAP